jgi:hypothetical protein
MATDQVTRLTGNGTEAHLVCGKPGCDRDAEIITELTFHDWSGILGACFEHHEDMGVVLLKGKRAAEDQPLDEDMPRD